MKRRIVSCVAISVFAIGISAGPLGASRTQAQGAASMAFDVVSIKRNANGAGMTMRMAPGNMSAFNVPVRQLIRQAYGLQDFQIVGGPDWMSADRFDVEGKFDPTPVAGLAGPPRIQAMLKTMLADRFKLAARSETREMPILALVMARDDKRLGPQLKPSAVDCAALQKQFAGARQGGGPPDGRGGPPLDGRGSPPPPGTPFSLGERPQCGGRGGFGQMIAGGIPMAQFVTQLSQLTSRVVVDRTGLTGGYDVDLKWSPTPDQLPQGPPPPGVEPPVIDPNGPSLFSALEEQLGLKLDARRGPVEVLVIDRIELPTEN
jgi:uncharacterized protein (TIGR03435 family)